MDWVLFSQGVGALIGGVEFGCPECGSAFTMGTEACPGCGAELDWDDSQGEGEEPTHGEWEEAEEGTMGAGIGSDPGAPAPPVETPERVMSTRGILFMALTLAGLIATLLLLRWDTFVHGATSETIGDDQQTLIYITAIGTIACSILTVIDILRTSSSQGPSVEGG